MVAIILSVIVLFSQTISSDNGLFQASISYGGGMELSVETFVLYNQNSEIMYTKHKPTTNTYFISNTGVVFALNKKHLYFYNQKGEEVVLGNLHYPNGFGFSPSNEIFFASDKDGIFVYSDEGELMYTLKPGRLFSSTEKGSMVTTISTDTLFVYEDGIQKFMRRLSTPYARSLSFSDDEKSIIIEVPSGIEIFDSQTGKKIAK